MLSCDRRAFATVANLVVCVSSCVSVMLLILESVSVDRFRCLCVIDVLLSRKYRLLILLLTSILSLSSIHGVKI